MRKMSWKQASKARSGSRYQRERRGFLLANPWCAGCKRRGVTTMPAVELDHIKPIHMGGSFWNHSNWQALCKPCHERKTKSERKVDTSGYDAALEKILEGYEESPA